MELYFIRHAQSENNFLLERTGSSEGRSSDPELSAIGVQQAQRLAEFFAKSMQAASAQPPAKLKPVRLTHLYSSLMIRALETATAISGAVDVPVTAWRDLHEGGGIYLKSPQTGERRGLPGLTSTELRRRFPELVLPNGTYEQGWWNRPYEEESEQLDRARRVLERLLKVHGGSDDRVGVVSHEGFYKTLLAILLSLPEDSGILFEIYNAAMTRIDLTDGAIRVVYMNRMDYIPSGLIT
ncbi:MAG: histidine phosphatase family protein [Anaerolineaceae bacterium]|nr:histidine phosphatase family protein [Anaerolineaceae bacterium]